jgi:hypothetical protein
MTDSAASALATALRRKIGRRLAVARWAKALLLPTLGVIFLFGRVSSWFVVAGLGLVLLETLAMMIGGSQRCPLCDATLVLRHERGDEFATTCPDCGFVID